MAHDGTIYASTPGFTLGTYEHEITGTDLTGKYFKKKVLVNESEILTKIVLEGRGNINDAGLYINHTRYMLVKYDKDNKLAWLRKDLGGACAISTHTLIIYAAYSRYLDMSNGKEQNAYITNEVVEKVAYLLISHGF